jgi:hypothetical protein
MLVSKGLDNSGVVVFGIVDPRRCFVNGDIVVWIWSTKVLPLIRPLRESLGFGVFRKDNWHSVVNRLHQIIWFGR